ncbi:CHAT domain-containing protein [Bradyrhizobium liaoningense]|uniref:CHAT domain-containing protein n=1 Tax=Bradyrhizobium liaoningense TaxID=43992 RepID=UPI001BA8422B|nr:CHAT domain-containing protein [Bradyrhizobium liaoningense]MBR0845461.1 CHAT domain-containing protein [Bradyrhizobium liaoningense]MBR0855370.1 CHAT domain-containing protein [Bradyrhizobium liaoningense]
MTDVPLQLSVAEDNANGFRLPQGYDHEQALARCGAIEIERKEDAFEIVLLDRRFHASEPAIVNLSDDGLFDVIQDCRGAWDRALEAFTTTRSDPLQGKKRVNPFENAWDKPISDDAFHGLGAQLAVAGRDLFRTLFERNRGTPLDRIARSLHDIVQSGACALTVKTTCFHVPWRMLYTHPAGELAADGSNFVPQGFWGYQHVVEQYPRFYPVSDQLRPRNGKLALGAALHERIDTDFTVDCIKRHRDFIQSSGNLLSYAEWTRIAELEQGLSADPFGQQIIYFLCHAEVAGTADAPVLSPPKLQLADGKIAAARIRNLIPNKFGPSPPLVFINACRGGQFATLVRQSFTFASEFLEQGAICVVGPQIEVPAVFAGEFGNRFFTALLERKIPPPQAGSVLRKLTQDMWARNNPFGLVYSLYAGADCHIHWSEEITS